MRGVVEKSNFFESIKMLYMRVCDLMRFLDENLTEPNKLKEVIMDSKRVVLGVDSKKFILKSPHTIMFVDTLYNLCKIDSSSSYKRKARVKNS
jgi:hypothetical protein